MEPDDDVGAGVLPVRRERGFVLNEVVEVTEGEAVGGGAEGEGEVARGVLEVDVEGKEIGGEGGNGEGGGLGLGWFGHVV